MNPGIIGGLVLPILGALPDALLVLVSGLGGTPAEAQEQVTSLSSSGRQPRSNRISDIEFLLVDLQEGFVDSMLLSRRWRDRLLYPFFYSSFLLLFLVSEALRFHNMFWKVCNSQKPPRKLSCDKEYYT
jgi:hypothetical protein